ncbi:hypothetical protein OBBRIDRAFT_798774 [Obba rivulosa]|uniref:Uncharacterized protein n=1 Tax=Obba rivulosa TaxID=1052685 RepID=A0A8E2AIJ2_9APHY|nr:hypothetical protein OBBRIDRAFT_798774 [Obba rivulosa]
MPRTGSAVRCYCKTCNGAYQSHSTRDRHQEIARRLASTYSVAATSQNPSSLSTSPVIPPSASKQPPSMRSSSRPPPSITGLTSCSLPSHSLATCPSDELSEPSDYLKACSPEAVSGVSIPRSAHDTRVAAAEARGQQFQDETNSSGFADLIGDDSDWEDDGDDESAQPEPRSSGVACGSISVSEPPLPDHANAAAAPLPSLPPLEPDPFYQEPTGTSDPKLPTLTDIHPSPTVFLIYILVFWLHLQWHLSFRACNALLTVLAIILQMLRTVLHPPMATSLPGVISALHAELKFQTLPVCPLCFCVFPATLPDSALCTHCNISLFVTETTPAEQRQGRATRRVRKPLLRFPFKSLQEQLSDMLQVPGMEDLCDQWHQKARQPGELVTPDSSRFFGPTAPSPTPPELRIGVSLVQLSRTTDPSVCRFSYLRSQIAPSHTSCPMSFNVINLPSAFRYRTSNLLLVGIMPGPKEAGPDQVQHFLRVIIDELLHLWRDGFIVKTPAFPTGRCVRVVLVGLICDKPAAHKLARYGSHSHTHFCTRDWITKALKASLDAFIKDAFTRRTNTEHRDHMERYRALLTDAAHEHFVKDHAACWSELAHLPYFDMCRMVVVDPMHNLFLGLVKSHFYHIWVQTKVLQITRKLRNFHALLVDLELSARLGHLPSLIGEPAGGSLTADQWLLLATVVGPLLLPQIWQDYGILGKSAEQLARNERLLEHRHSAIEKTLAARRKKKKQTDANIKGAPITKKGRKRARTTHTTQASEHAPATRRSGRVRKPTERARDMELESDDAGAALNDEDVYSGAKAESEGEIDNGLPCNMHPGDLSNFLKLAQALPFNVADRLIHEYCSELLTLYGSAVIRPNHHYATHTAECIADYGPLREFWTFIFERMNKVLKSYHTDNHAGGELECSFLREFFRTVNTSCLLAQASHAAPASSELAQASHAAPASSGINQAINAMFKASSDDRGTLQALSQKIDEQTEDAMLNLNLSPRYSFESLPPHIYFAFLHYLQKMRPGLAFHSMIAVNMNPDSICIQDRALLFNYVIVNGKRFYASSRSSKRAESFIAIRDAHDPACYLIGELIHILSVTNSRLGQFVLGHIDWFCPSEVRQEDTAWAECADLHVRLWKPDVFDTSNRANALINLQDIISGVVRATVHAGETRCWATILTNPPYDL